MSTPTAIPFVTSDLSAPPPTYTTLGARLAAASREMQGFPSTVSDPAVLSELRGLCVAPRPTRRTRKGSSP